MALTDKQIKSIKGESTIKKYFDGEGLYLQVTPSGSKAWRLRYRIHGKDRSIAIGSYNDVSLKEARIVKSELRGKIAKSIDPLQEREDLAKAQKVADDRKNYTFEKLLNEYFEWKPKTGNINTTTLSQLRKRFNSETLGKGKYVENLNLSQKPIPDVTKEDLQKVLTNIAKRGAIESARRFHTQLVIFFTWARSSDYLPEDSRTVAERIDKDHLLPLGEIKVVSYGTIKDPKILGELLHDIDNVICEKQTKLSLQILPHLAVRPSNLRKMTWDEINFDERLWVIPKEKMKRAVAHVVPLSDYALEILREAKKLRLINPPYVFPSSRTKGPLSHATLNSVLHRIKDESGEQKYNIVSHSFRSIFSTFANEAEDKDKNLMWESKVIEAALAHGLSNAVESAYNKADYLDQRRVLMQWWTDFLLDLKKS